MSSSHVFFGFLSIYFSKDKKISTNQGKKWKMICLKDLGENS